MPRISEFYGIAIYLYYRDHYPPHFHAVYAEHEAEILIGSGEVLRGRLPPRAASLVREWEERYRDQLKRDWQLAREKRPLVPIPPLD